ncbi:MAG: Arm DNA-binding domain-containing protein [Rhodoplanes sp.]
MARRGRGLTARKVEAAKPGKYEDGHGLRLVVSASGARKWVFRYMLAGKRVEMGLGSVPAITLAQARERAADARRLVKAGTQTQSRRGAPSVRLRRRATPLERLR